MTIELLKCLKNFQKFIESLFRILKFKRTPSAAELATPNRGKDDALAKNLAFVNLFGSKVQESL